VERAALFRIGPTFSFVRLTDEINEGQDDVARSCAFDDPDYSL
jgi:hypothetical protein